MGGAPRATAPSVSGRSFSPQRMPAQSRANVQPRASVQTAPRTRLQTPSQPRATRQNPAVMTQRTAPSRRPQQAGDFGMRSRDLGARSRDLNVTRDRAAINRGTYDSINRTRDRAVGADRSRERAADVARDSRPGNRTDLQNRARAGADRLSAEARARGRDLTRPSRGDINRQLGLQHRTDRQRGDLQRRTSDRPQWVSTRNDQARNISDSVARAIRDPQRQFRSDRVGDRGERIGDRGERIADRGDRGDRIGDRGDRVRDGSHRDWDRWRGGDRWDRWANPVRNHWRHNHRPWFNNHWWANHSVHRPYRYLNYFGFGIGPWGWGYRPWNYWWSQPTWYGVTGWFNDWGWYDPWYYDYGYGGNVVYYDDGVYVGDTLVGSPVEYAESAAALASVPADALDRDPTGDWMALGTFAMVAKAQDEDPSRSIQLAVDKQGIISGTYFDRQRDEAFAVTGRVDRETQRVAFRIDNNPDVVYETGIYNLTQDQTPVLVHDGSEDPFTYLLVRLDQPEGEISR